MSQVGRRAVTVWIFALLIMLAYLPYVALYEQGVFTQQDMEVISGGFTLVLILTMFLLFRALRDSIDTLHSERAAEIVASGGGAVVYIAIAVQQLLNTTELSAALASWALLFAIIVSSDLWIDPVAAWIESQRGEQLT